MQLLVGVFKWVRVDSDNVQDLKHQIIIFNKLLSTELFLILQCLLSLICHIVRKKHKVWDLVTWVWDPSIPFTRCMTLPQLCNFFSELFHLKGENNGHIKEYFDFILPSLCVYTTVSSLVIFKSNLNISKNYKMYVSKNYLQEILKLLFTIFINSFNDS